MSYIIELPQFSDERGKLTVIEKLLPFKIKRVYFLYDVKTKRGGHRHKKTIQALICINGSCEIFIDDGVNKKNITLNSPNKCLVLEPKDWHTMDHFSKNSTLLVISSEFYDSEDYIDEKYL